MKANITVYGQPLYDVVQKHAKVVFNYPKELIWNQAGVSLDKRLAEDPGLAELIDNILSTENLENYIVHEEDAAPTRCIDGRILAGWEDSPELQARPLGPKVAGGTFHAALTHRVVDTEHLTENLRFEEDIKTVVEKFKAIGIGYGGHIDDNLSGSNTGCGAVDNINLILDRLQRPTHQEQLRGLCELIMGEAYDGKYIVNEVIGRLLYLDALKPTYMPRENNDPHGEFLYKKTVVDTLRAEANENEDVVPSLHGPHKEIAAVLNFVPRTTFDTDKFSADNNNEVQVFGWDVWHMREEAKRLYPYNMDSSIASQEEAILNRIKYVTTRTLLGISTIMVLTDGSLRLIAVTA